MARLIVYYAHPGQRHSRANRAMARAARNVSGISFVDLYAEYPRYDVSIDREQQRLLDHDVILFQFPLFWYSTPSLIKEWIDLVLEHGFAYGHDGDKLTGKTMMVATTAAGPEDAYAAEGYQHYSLREFLRPLEQTARLCHMHFPPPYVLYGSLAADDAEQIEPHARGYGQLLEAIRDDHYDFARGGADDVFGFDRLPIQGGD